MGDRNRALPFIPKILNLTLLLDVTPNQKNWNLFLCLTPSLPWLQTILEKNISNRF